VLARGNAARPDCLADHVRAIAAATDLPLIVFQYPAVTGLTYPLDTLVRLAEEVPSFRAIKDWCNDPALAEKHIEVLHGLRRPVTVLSTHSAWLFASLVTGADGLLSGSGSVIADLQARLFDAVQAGGDQGVADAADLGGFQLLQRRAHHGAGQLAEQHQRLLHPVVHVEEGIGVEDPRVRQPAVVGVCVLVHIPQKHEERERADHRNDP